MLEHSKAGSVLGHIKDVELRQSLDRPISTLEAAGKRYFVTRNKFCTSHSFIGIYHTVLLNNLILTIVGELADSLRPKSRQGRGVGDVDPARFTISNRPPTSHGRAEVEEVEFTPHKPLVKTDFNVSEIVYYTNDWLITSIFDNTKVSITCTM